MKQRNKEQKRKVHSIRGQFAWIFIGLMIGTILLCLMINYLFLGKVYMQSKLDVIHDAYGTIKQAAESDSYDTEEFARELDDVCRSYNMTVCVMDVNSNMKYVSINGGERLENRLIGYVFGLSIPFNDQRVIENGDDYVIKRTGQEDKEYLEIYGRLNTGISFIMQTPLSSIQESAKIANRFYALAGCLGAMAGGIIIWFVSRSVTKPILELNNISERMVQLDFEAKYQGKAHNEIDLLGENINKLSDSLEKTISELKTANNELQRDVEKKEAIDEMRKEFLANVSHEQLRKAMEAAKKDNDKAIDDALKNSNTNVTQAPKEEQKPNLDYSDAEITGEYISQEEYEKWLQEANMLLDDTLEKGTTRSR